MEKIDFIPFLSQVPTKLFVSGLSMKPFLEENDQIFVVAALKEEIKEGDLIVFRRDGKDYVHRVVLIEKSRFYEIGDNQRTGTWASFDKPLGKVILVEKKDGTKIDLSEVKEIKFARRMALIQKIRYRREEMKKKIKFKPFIFVISKIFSLLEIFLKSHGLFEERD